MLKYLNQGKVEIHPPAKHTLFKGYVMFSTRWLQILCLSLIQEECAAAASLAN